MVVIYFNPLEIFVIGLSFYELLFIFIYVIINNYYSIIYERGGEIMEDLYFNRFI